MATFEIAGHTWHYETTSSRTADAPPLVLLHGVSASMHMYDLMVEPLAEHFTVYRLDWLGHGETEHPADLSLYAMPKMAAYLGECLDRWGLDRAYLLAHSYGGMVALEFVLTYPERVLGLGLIGTTPGPVWKHPEARAVEDALRAYVREHGMRATWDAHIGAHKWRHRLEKVPGGLALLGDEFCAGTADGYLNTRMAMDEKPRHTGRLGEIQCPVALFVGEFDDELMPGMEVLRAKIPHANFYVIEDAGHSPQRENPPRCAEILCEGMTALVAQVEASTR